MTDQQTDQQQWVTCWHCRQWRPWNWGPCPTCQAGATAPTMPQSPPQSKTGPRWGLVIGVVAGVLVLGFVGLIGLVAVVAAGNRSLAAKPLTVTYEVTGSARMADITYTRPGGDTAQQSKVDVPVKLKSTGQPMTFTFHKGDFVYMSAQNATDSGDIACDIKVNGVTVKTNRSFGEFSIVTCSGRL